MAIDAADLAAEKRRFENDMRQALEPTERGRREYIATRVLAAMLTTGGRDRRDPTDAARWAVAYADALLGELDKPATTYRRG